MNKFLPLGDECETKEWARKVDEFCWAVIKLLKWEEITGEKGFVVQYGYVDIDDESLISDALSLFGMKLEDACEQTKVLAMVENGYLDVQSEWFGEKYLTPMVAAFKYANR